MTGIDQNEWMQTASGGVCDFLDFKISFDDIALSLAKQCRYAGHTRGFLHLSVAEHSVHIARAIAKDQHPDAAWAGLMHDAHEAIIQDLIRPVKGCLPQYKGMENVAAAAVRRRYKVNPKYDELVKMYDNAILLDEQRQAMAPCSREWGFAPDAVPLGISIPCWSPEVAYRKFWECALMFKPSEVLYIGKPAH